MISSLSNTMTNITNNGPTFAFYVIACLILCLLFMKIYVFITPHNEFKEIDDGDQAAAIALGGALVGFAIPVSLIASRSVNLIELVLWAIVAMVVQISIFFLVWARYRTMPDRIKDGDKSIAWFVAMVSIAGGL